MSYILTFSVCKKMLIRREEVIIYLKQHVAGLELYSFDLDDRFFLMRLRTKKEDDIVIQRLVQQKGLKIDVISCDKISKVSK